MPISRKDLRFQSWDCSGWAYTDILENVQRSHKPATGLPSLALDLAIEASAALVFMGCGIWANSTSVRSIFTARTTYFWGIAWRRTNPAIFRPGRSDPPGTAGSLRHTTPTIRS